MAYITIPIRICIPKDNPDPETGCQVCGSSGGTGNIRMTYEQCRQAYFLKKQTEILGSQQSSQKSSTEKEQTIQNLELKNQELKGLLEQQNKQISELIQETAGLQNTKLLNTGLFVVLGIFLICFILLFIRKRKKKL